MVAATAAGSDGLNELECRSMGRVIRSDRPDGNRASHHYNKYNQSGFSVVSGFLNGSVAFDYDSFGNDELDPISLDTELA